MRYRVTRIWYDDGGFGYTAPPIEEVIRDWLTRAEAKAIYKHYTYVLSSVWDPWCDIEVEVLNDEGWWENVSHGWGYRYAEEQENWFERKGFDYNWWLQFDEIRKIG